MIIGIIYFFQKYLRHLMDMVYEFFSKKILVWNKKCLQLNNNYQNFVFGVVFDIHQEKLRSALQKTVPGGLTKSSFFSEDWPLFLLELLVLIRLSRLGKGFWSDRTNSGKRSVQTIQTIPQNYPDPRLRSDQIIHTLGGALIRLSRP